MLRPREGPLTLLSTSHLLEVLCSRARRLYPWTKLHRHHRAVLSACRRLQATHSLRRRGNGTMWIGPRAGRVPIAARPRGYASSSIPGNAAIPINAVHVYPQGIVPNLNLANNRFRFFSSSPAAGSFHHVLTSMLGLHSLGGEGGGGTRTQPRGKHWSHHPWIQFARI